MSIDILRTSIIYLYYKYKKWRYFVEKFQKKYVFFSIIGVNI